MPADRWASVLDVNLASVLTTTDALLKAGTIRPGGRIVATASIAGLAGNSGQTNYAASKAGIVGLVRSLGPRALAEHGVTVNARSSVTIDLNRACSSYEALAGVDDLTLKLGKVRFAVYADGVRLWNSGTVKGGDPAVPVRVDISGRETLRLVTEPHGPFDSAALADWARSRSSADAKLMRRE